MITHAVRPGAGRLGRLGTLVLGIAFALGAGLPPAAGADEAGRTPDADAAARSAVKTSGFVFKEIEVDADSALSGDGHQVSLGGKPVSLHGQEIAVGDALRPVALQGTSMQSVALTDGKGRVRVLSVVPSLKTKTCEQQTHYLSEKSGGLAADVELVTISLDSPETQKGFAEEARIGNVTFLSDADDAAFGRAHGLLIQEPRILARAVLVVDAEGTVRYLQVVPEVSHMPDMEAAFAFARGLVEPGSGG